MQFFKPWRRSPRYLDLATDTVFARFSKWRGTAAAGYDVNFLGQRIDVRFVAGWNDAARMRERQWEAPYPAVSEEVFEWLLMLDAVMEARESFTMIEAGAGYGRWLVGAVCALRQAQPGMPFRLVGVEPEPDHFEWMGRHFRDNDLDPAAHRLIQGAVAAEDGTAYFLMNADPTAWYGQFLVPTADIPAGTPGTATREVPTYSIASLLSGLDRVDLMDFDIQGAETVAIAAGIGLMTEKVRRVFVETHSPQIHEAVEAIFRANGWECLSCYGFRAGSPSVERTPFGDVSFEAGVQTWINPRRS